MNRRVLLVVVLNVLAILGLAFAFPEPMLAPGPLQPGHAALAADCLACHAPFAGPDRAACEACHTVNDIGVRLVSGAPAPQRPDPDAALTEARFHQALGDAPCAACHTEHGAAAVPRFKHALLDGDQRDDCAACHVAPDTALHSRVQSFDGGCRTCHNTADWENARFDHAQLSPADPRDCVACHAAPTDALHQGLGAASADCAGCHEIQGWRPASFEHGRYFQITGEHRASCETCHPGATAGTVNLERYTCYGCHEHSAAGVRAEHVEEGIRDFADCVRCHRSGEEHEGREGGGDGEGRGRDDD
jgi:hypothetical protein